MVTSAVVRLPSTSAWPAPMKTDTESSSAGMVDTCTSSLSS